MILGDYHYTILIIVGIYIILTLGLNIIVGYAGQIHIGIAAYLGVGAYTAAMLSARAGFSFIYILPIGIILATAIAVLTGLPSLRVRDDFLAITTIGIAIVFESLLIYLPWFGGADGMRLPKATVFSYALPKSVYFLVVAGFAVLCIIVNRSLVRSWMGIAWESIREDEVAAQLIGINAARFKILAFAFGGAFCGLAGVLYAHFIRSVTPYDFGFVPSILPLVMVVFGGIGTIRGPIVGAAFLGASPEIFRFIQEYRILIYGGLLLLMMRYMPSGILGIGSPVLAKLSLLGARRSASARQAN